MIYIHHNLEFLHFQIQNTQGCDEIYAFVGKIKFSHNSHHILGIFVIGKCRNSKL